MRHNYLALAFAPRRFTRLAHITALALVVLLPGMQVRAQQVARPISVSRQQVPTLPSSVQACFVSPTGTPYLIGVPGAPPDCYSTLHSKFVWNLQGAVGPKGDVGPAGLVGPVGPIGVAGARGDR